MNTAQRFMLRALEHPANFINNNLAKRAGLLGRIGRFWSIGSREYGSHTTTKILRYININYLFLVRHFFSKNSASKTFIQKQNYINGYFFLYRFGYYFHGFSCLLIPFFMLDFKYYTRNSFYLLLYLYT